MSIPNDPIILLSWVNTKLRDQYPSLDELCRAEDIDRQHLVARLSTVGYFYNSQLNKFI